MFSNILGRKKQQQMAASPTSAQHSNLQRSPQNTTDAGPQLKKTQSSFFSSFWSSGNKSNNKKMEQKGTFQAATPRELQRVNTGETAGRMSQKKGSAPNLGVKQLSATNMLHKSASQPSMAVRRSAEISRSKKNRRRSKKDDRGFLDRAFENAASLSFEDDEEAISTEDPGGTATRPPSMRQEPIQDQ
jgi:hypothetical protein